jgi:hypothetical protein
MVKSSLRETAQYTGMGGWLRLYIGTLFVGLLADAYRAINGLMISDTYSLLLNIADATAKLYIGISVLNGNLNGVRVAKVYHTVVLGIHACLLWVCVVGHLFAPSNQTTCVESAGLAALHFAWLWYLLVSKRIRATFGLARVARQRETEFEEGERVQVLDRGLWVSGTVAVDEDTGMFVADDGWRIRLDAIHDAAIREQAQSA